MQVKIPMGLYAEAFETYEAIRPVDVVPSGAIYILNTDDAQHLMYMGRTHLEAQISGAVNEDGYVPKCRRWLKQLNAIAERID